MTRLEYLLQTPKALLLPINLSASLLAVTLELMEGPTSKNYCKEESQGDKRLKAKQFAAKIAKESAFEQEELQKAAKNGGFWGLVKRANDKITSKPQTVAVLPDTDFLKGKPRVALKQPKVQQQDSDKTGIPIANTKSFILTH